MNSCILYCVNASRTKSREKIHHDANEKFRTHITFQANFYIKLHESYLVPEEQLDYKILDFPSKKKKNNNNNKKKRF